MWRLRSPAGGTSGGARAPAPHNHPQSPSLPRPPLPRTPAHHRARWQHSRLQQHRSQQPPGSFLRTPHHNLTAHHSTYAISTLRKQRSPHPTTPNHIHMSHVQCACALYMRHVSARVRLLLHGSAGRTFACRTFSCVVRRRNTHSGRLRAPQGPCIVGILLRTFH